MDHDRWQCIRTILEGAFEREAADRAVFVDAACGDDSDLRAEVGALLAAESDAGPLEGHLAQIPAVVAAAVDEDHDVDPLIGLQIDRYRVLQRIDSGGFATVYLAERADDQYKQRVALKVIKAGVIEASVAATGGTDDLFLRFRNERQILAGLDHPNIARLLDGGRLEGDAIPEALRGRPYMVMELVEGAPIDQYCDAKRRTLSERLNLFQTVCQAVHSAHQNLVVHRDLKPANILVSHDGVVKLLDFGIAKVLNPELSSATLAVTHGDVRMLSPAYASPEQLLGEPITTASDVYALGVVLFELLCGERPHREDEGLEVLVAQIVDTDPPRPSTVLSRAAPSQARTIADQRRESVRGLRRTLDGDLGAIVSRALARDPTVRYRSAEALGDDLARHGDGRPVDARRGERFYRLRRWFGRHRISMTAAAVGLGLLILALVVAVHQARSAAAARDAAERKAATATEITEFVAGIFDSASPSASAGTTITARALLEEGARRVDSELDDDEDVRASLLHVIGRAHMSLGLYDEAWPFLEEALTLRQQRLPEGHRDIALTQRLAAQTLAVRGRIESAIAMHRESLAALEAEKQRDPTEIARGLTLLSYAVGVNGDEAEAERLRRRSLDLLRAVLGDEHPGVAQGWNDLGHVLTSRGRANEAETALRQALLIRRAHFGDRHPDLATTLGNLARTHLAAGRLADAEAASREALEIAEQVFDPAHLRLAIARNGMASVHLAAGRIDDAEAAARQAMVVFEQTYPGGHTRMALTWGILAEVALAREDTAAAGHALNSASHIMDGVAPANHLSRIELRGIRGRWLLAVGRADEGETELRATIAGLRARQSPASLALRRAAEALVERYTETERFDEATRLRPLTRVPAQRSDATRSPS